MTVRDHADRLRRLDAQARWGKRASNLLWRARYDGSDFSIVSNNCWGGSIYQSLRRPYLSPFVGMFLMAPCYIRLLEDFSGHMAHAPRPLAESRYESIRLVRGRESPRYPIGLLGDEVEIHFLHYATWEEALAKWNRRTARICRNRLFVKFGDQNQSSEESVRRFLALPYARKLCLTNRADMAAAGAVCMGGQGPTTRLQEDIAFRRLVDVPNWLCEGRARGGRGLARLSRCADVFAADAATRHLAERIAAGEEPELNLDQLIDRANVSGKGASCGI